MSIKTRTLVGRLAALALLLPAVAAATRQRCRHRQFPGAAALPGPIVDPGTPAVSLGLLKAAPDVALPGSKFTVSGTGLPAGKNVVLTWWTANVDWMLDARPDSVDYLGRKVTKFTVAARQGADERERRVLDDAEGALRLRRTARPVCSRGRHPGRERRPPDRTRSVDQRRRAARSARRSRSSTAVSARASTRAARRSCTTTSTQARLPRTGPGAPR